MNEMFPDANHVMENRRLNLLWYSVLLPGSVVVVMLALYAWTKTAAYTPPVIDESFATYLPVILGTALVFGLGLTAFLKSRLPGLVARTTADPFQRVSIAAFTLLGAADAPAFIGFGVYLVNPADWLALTIVFYAFAAGVLFKPDFAALLAIEKA